MKILIIGDGNHQLINSYVENLFQILSKTDNELSIDLFTTRESNSKRNKYFTNVFRSFPSNIRLNIRGFNRIITPIRIRYFFSLIKEKYDFIHIHYVSQDMLVLRKLFAKKSNNLLCSFWGSDFYRINDSQKRKLIPLLGQAKFITFSNSQMATDFSKFYNHFPEKIKICRYGQTPMEELHKIDKIEKTECKKRFLFQSDKIIICVGYNLSEGQQHFKIIQNIEQANELKDFSDKVLFVFPITYGSDQKYKLELKNRLLSFPYEYELIEHFLTDLEVAYLRKSTDIFIQLQKTDQFSGAMTENLYSQNIVITGAWLPYGDLLKMGVFLYQINSIDYLSELLIKILKNIKAEKIRFHDNQLILKSFGFWRDNIKDWAKLY